MLRDTDYEAIIRQGIGETSIKLVSEKSDWSQFDELEDHTLALHEWMVNESGVKGFDKIEFMDKLNEHNAVMRNVTRKVGIGDMGEPSFFSLFGDLQVSTPNQLIYELAKARMMWMAAVKANKLMRKMITSIVKIVETLLSDKFKKFIADEKLVWMADEELDDFMRIFKHQEEEGTTLVKKG